MFDICVTVYSATLLQIIVNMIEFSEKVVIVSYSQLQQEVASGTKILWTGSQSDSTVLIRLYKNGENKIVSLDTQKLPVPKDPYIVRHNEATSDPLSFVGVTWQKFGWLKSIRLASIYGINIGSRCKAGLGIVPDDIPDICTMGYDIEVSLSLVRGGGFPPPYSKITSIAIWCSCGYCEAWTTISHKPIKGIIFCKSSSQLVNLSIQAIKKHVPLWLVGYNCYQFDNCSLEYHAPRSLKPIFRAINSGAKSVSRHAFYIDLPGINNVDLYSYLDKCLRRKYTALSLGVVAQYHGIGGKTQMPTTEDESTLYQLIDYNINDSRLTSMLWHKTDANAQILGLCVASCAPLIDCVRYVTGTMSSCAVSSYCISNNMLMDWSECNLRIGYEGGTVLDPIRSVFKHVIVCDFSAMYPTIIKDIGISPENISILDTCSKVHEDKIIWWNDRCTIACIKGKIIKYTTSANCMTRNVLEVITTLRNKYKKTNVSYSTALKVLANSLYGALGFASSPLHSPRCAATVTVAGRTALALGYTVFKGLGLNVVYGDTDSCFLASGKHTNTHFNGDTSAHIKTALSIFHKILEYTPFPNMRMEEETAYKSVLLIDKKHYAYADSESKIHTKGLSSTRKDRLGICRDMTSIVAKQILLQDNIEDARNIIVNLLNICYSSANARTLDMYSVSKEVRYEGNSCYRFTDPYGDDISIPVSRADKTTYIDYDVSKVLKALETDMNRICIPAGLGTVSSMLIDADF